MLACQVHENEFGRFYRECFDIFISPDKSKSSWYPSITTMLGYTKDQSGLDAWRKRIGVEEAKRITDKACERGEDFHTALEYYFSNGEIDSKTSVESRCLIANVRRHLKKVTNVRLQENVVINHEIGVAGRFDLLADYAKVLSIVDFKQTLKLKKNPDYLYDYYLQTTFYAESVKPNYFPKQCVILLSGVEDCSGDCKIINPYLHLLDLYDRIDVFYTQHPNIKQEFNLPD